MDGHVEPINTTKHDVFEPYHDVKGAQHQAKFNSLSAQGYRMISLSVYGDPGDVQANGVRAAQLAIAKNGVTNVFVCLHVGRSGLSCHTTIRPLSARELVKPLIKREGG